jgi:hypothetical protein
MIAFYHKLTKADAEKVISGVEAFFKKFPRRRVCRTDIYGGTTFHRGKVREELSKLMEGPDGTQ